MNKTCKDCKRIKDISFFWRDKSLTSGYSNRCKECQKNLSRKYGAWSSMISRCYNKNTINYYLYGGRGITVCDRWKKYNNFFNDMGEKPDGMSLERIDNSKGYSKENCRWATRKEQANNRRTNIIIEYLGEKKTLSQWSTELDINYRTLLSRIRKSWKIEDAFSKKTNMYLLDKYGINMRLSELSVSTGISKVALRKRLKSGWDIERVIATPLNVKKSHCKTIVVKEQ